MQRLIHERGRLAELKSARGSIDRLVNDVYALLRVDPDETVDDLIAAGCADGAFDRVALLRAVQAWASGTAAEQPKSRTEERRGGKEGGSTCRSGWSTYS